MMIHAKIGDAELVFKTTPNLFSPHNIDRGTLAMLSVADFQPGNKVLDLGCGYGVVGIYAAKIAGPENIVMVDVDQQAVELAKENALLNQVEGICTYQSDGFKDVNQSGFDLILSNPPYHVDFSVPKVFIEKGFNRLKIGGRMFMVTKRKEWYKNKLTAIFGGLKKWEIDGYFVFMAMKKSDQYAKSKG